LIAAKYRYKKDGPEKRPIAAVGAVPYCGCPPLSSKMQPTVLIARMLDIASSSPDGRLIGGGGVGFDSFDRHTIVAWRRFMGAGRKPMWLEPVGETDTREATRGKRSAPGAAKHAHGEAVIRTSIARNETNASARPA
jgi:hypothetical protein